MPPSNVLKHKFDAGVAKFLDGTATPLELTPRWDRADLKLSGIVAGGRETVPYEGRGVLRSLRKGKLKFPTVSISFDVSDLSETGTGTILDWLFKRTPWTARKSTTEALGDADCFHLQFTQEGTTYGDGADQNFKIEDIGGWEVGYEEGEPNAVTLTGTVFGDIEINGAAAFIAPRAA